MWKPISLLLFFTVLTFNVFGQQFLWTTANDSTIKHVPLEKVTDMVLEFYDHYEYYFDGSGYSKEGFFKEFEKSQSFKNTNSSAWKELKEKISKVDSLMIIAFKSNSGYGSEVLVMCISKANINSIGFLHNYERGAITIYPSEKDKFIKWFNTLLE